MVSDYDIYFQECRLLRYQRHKYRSKSDKKDTEQRIDHSIHEHNLPVEIFANRKSKLKVQSQAVKLLTRGCHGPEIGPICPCESGLLPVLNGPWELLKLTRMHVEINSIEVYKTYLILFIELSGALEMRRFLGTYIRAQQYEVGIFGPDRNLRWGEFRPPVWKFNNSNSPL